MAKISIIIPVYNVEKYLRQCLESVVNQTFTDLEVICVNDCSPDNSAEILNEYAQKDKRIRVINLEKNGGVGNARNLALKEVASDYVMFLDSDDWLALNACELVYNKISKNDNDFVYFNYYKYYEETGSTGYNKNKFKVLLKFFDTEQINPSELKEPFACSSECWFKIYKTEFLRNNNLEFLVGRNFEDQIFYSKVFCLAKSVSVINEPLLYYRQRNSSICNNIKYALDVPNSWGIVLNNIPASACQVCRDSIVLNSINSLLYWFKRYRAIERSIEQKYYKDMRKQFKKYDKETMKRLNRYVDITAFNLIRNISTYNMYKLVKILIRICGFEYTRRHTCFYFMGLSLKLKR